MTKNIIEAIKLEILTKSFEYDLAQDNPPSIQDVFKAGAESLLPLIERLIEQRNSCYAALVLADSSAEKSGTLTTANEALLRTIKND